MPITFERFFEYLFESVNSGKMSISRECLFCGSKLNQERFEATRVRIGRLRFLLRSIENGSNTADQLLQEILTLTSEISHHYLPEDNPDWWMEKAKKIYNEASIA